MIKIGVAGCGGRMGKMIIDSIFKEESAEFAGGFERKEYSEIGKAIANTDIIVEDDIEKIIDKVDVIIDFTTVESTLNNVKIAEKNNKKIVIGTTGLKDEDINVLKECSKNIPVVFAANMSKGVNLLFKLVKDVAKVIGNDSDIEIVEYHHNQKKDAPSGTAKTLAQNIADTLNLNLNEVMNCGREGMVGQRPKKEIGVMAVRAGDIVGEHIVTFAMEGERVELVHKAHSRMNFAKGAVNAALWLADKNNGFYNMNDVLGIK